MPAVNASACFQPVAQLSILNLSPSTAVLSETALCQRAAKEATQCQDPLQRLRLQLLAQGMATGKNLIRCLFMLHKNELDHADLVKTLSEFVPLEISETAAKHICEQLAKNLEANGKMGLQQVAEQLMTPISAQRRAFVRCVFEQMDTEKQDVVPVSAMRSLFEHRRHPQFQSGKKTREELFADFLVSFQCAPDDRVSFAEFLAFYAAQSAAVQSDIHFDFALRGQWKI